MKYIVDFEGFSLNCTFVIKEFVLQSLDFNQKKYFLLNSPSFNFNNLRRKDRKSVNFCEKNLHLIRWRTRGANFAELRDFLNQTLKADDTVYIKGEEKVKVFCRQLNPVCLVRDINNLLSYAEVSKDWIIPARKLLSSRENSCPLYFHKSNPHCALIKTEIFSQMLTKVLGKNE